MHLLFGVHPILLLTAFAAAAITGAIGYGFSSITVPVALAFVGSRVLNPALVLIELALNAVSLSIQWRALKRIAGRMIPLLIGILPGAVLGSFALSLTAGALLKTSTYGLLLPLVLLQSAGFRKPIRRERTVAGPVGFGLGLLYATTTISGPPLALLLNNQGLTQDEFRAGIALLRLGEAVVTLTCYLLLGLYTAPSLHLCGVLLPLVVVGVPLGRWLLRGMGGERFRAITMTFVSVLVSVGLGGLIAQLGLDLRICTAFTLTAVGLSVIAGRFGWMRAQRQKVRVAG